MIKLFSIVLLFLYSAQSFALNLKDVSDQYRYHYELLSAFDELYLEDYMAPEAAADDITHIFHFDHEEFHSLPVKTKPTRLEVYMTAGDEMMEYIVYFVTDAPQVMYDKNGEPVDHYNNGNAMSFSSPRVYLIKELSPGDGVRGLVKPKVDIKKVKEFIEKEFLYEIGWVPQRFLPACLSLPDYRKKDGVVCEDTVKVLKDLAKKHMP